MMFDTFSSAQPQVKQGRARALAVTSARRNPAAPDIPTLAETLPGFEADAWDGVFGLGCMVTPLSFISTLAAG